MIIKIDNNIHIELINENHAQGIFDIVDENRSYLKKWLAFIDRMQTVEFADNFIRESMLRKQAGIEYAFVIIENSKLIGRIGIYKIDNQNKIGEIGYWLAENAQGKGILTKSCKVLIDFCFSNLQLNRIEIKCATKNLKSSAIPTKLNFTHEGIIRQGEWLNDQFVDLNLYSILRQEV